MKVSRRGVAAGSASILIALSVVQILRARADAEPAGTVPWIILACAVVLLVIAIGGMIRGR